MGAVSGPQISGKRVLVLGAETAVGRSAAAALAEAGARLALVAATPEAEAAFAVQRLARRLGGIAQAIDATNEAAVRVMLRQVSKALGGLEAVLFAAEAGAGTATALDLIVRLGARELARSGGGALVVAGEAPVHIALPAGVRMRTVDAEGRDAGEVAAAVVRALAGEGEDDATPA